MDAASKSTRKYPSYTLAELESFVAAGRGNDVMIAEIAARKAGSRPTKDFLHMYDDFKRARREAKRR